MNPGGPITVGDLTITPNTVNHSIIDAMALFIDTPIGKIIHTGDFKMDPSPHFGDVMEWNVFKKAGEEGVLLLLSDSTNVERDEHAIQDEAISDRLEEVLKSAKGLTLISMFSSNVGRMANIFKIASKMGKKIALTGRSMEQNVRLAMEHGAISFPHQSFIPIDAINQYDRNRVLILSTGCQGEPRSALNRIAHDEHAHVSLTPDDVVILSSSQIPGNDVAISKLINELFRRGAHVLYDAIDEVHTSGHATKPELRKMLELVKPKYFVPIHGEYRHLVHHADLARDSGVAEQNISVIQNGEIFEIGRDGIQIVDEVTELRILVDGREGVEITKDVLRDRRRLAETGVVFCMVAREKESGKILTKPEIHAKGLINASFESWLIDEALKVVDQVIQGYRRELRQGVVDPDFAENIRIELRRFFERNTGKKPTVVPMVMDV
jgi:ribonuclease J